jgi:RNA polymerase sigma-70 factor (ECF subfamily)
VDAHGAELVAFLRRLCGNSHDAEDVFQETSVRVWRHLDDLPRVRNPGGWLMTIAYRAFLDMRSRRETPATSLSEEPTDRRNPGVEATAELAEDAIRVRHAISSLPAGTRDVVMLHYVGGMSLSQTATAMQLSEGTVKSRLNSALIGLRRLLK